MCDNMKYFEELDYLNKEIQILENVQLKYGLTYEQTRRLEDLMKTRRETYEKYLRAEMNNEE
nr:MAG TPA: hypothetical protein [Caudoviricetes sp.]